MPSTSLRLMLTLVSAFLILLGAKAEVLNITGLMSVNLFEIKFGKASHDPTLRVKPGAVSILAGLAIQAVGLLPDSLRRQA